MTTTTPADRHDTYIIQALSVSGGHLHIGRGGFCLYYAWGATLSGYDCDEMKAACIAAGLPVIDSREVEFDAVVELAFRGPMVAVGQDPDPKPWHLLSFVPLEEVVASYARAGAHVWNVSGVAAVSMPVRREPLR
jgi:hypothetical protein